MSHRLILVRHAETLANKQSTISAAGVGPGLTVAGTEMSKRLANRLARNVALQTDGATVLVSPARRAQETAAIATAGVSAYTWSGLRELDTGPQAIRGEEELNACQALLDGWCRGQRLGQGHAGGELGLEFKKRMETLVESIKGNDGQAIIAFTHYAVVRMLLAQAIGFGIFLSTEWPKPAAACEVTDLDGRTLRWL